MKAHKQKGSQEKTGNAAKLREALDAALVLLEEHQKLALCRNGFVQIKTKYCDLKDAIEKCRSALAKPPRNCDMGTAEEQSRRMAKFCRSHGVVDGVPRCEKCRFLGNDKCELKWAQMTYNESEVK